VIAGKLLRHIRNKGDLVRMYRKNQFHEILVGITFNIKFGSDTRFQFVYIFSADVPFIGPGMNGNPLGTELLAGYRNLNDIRHIASSGIAQCCNFVYIYTQSRHFFNFEPESYNFVIDLKNIITSSCAS